jgi:tetratricopeptide (TPR) repeat protein
MTFKCTILLAACIVFYFTCRSQDKIDSLKSSLNSIIEESQKADLLYTLAYEYADVSNTLAAKYGLEGFAIATKLNDTLNILKTGRITSYALRKLNKIDSAILIGLQIVPMSENKKYITESIKIINGLAWGLALKAQYDKALHYYFRNLQLVKASKDTVYEIAALNNIGLIYFKLTNFDKALDYYFRCRDLQVKARDSVNMDRLLINVGHCYAGKEDLSEAKKYILAGLSICENSCSEEIIAEGYFGLGYILSETGFLNKGEEYFMKSYNAARKTNYTRLIFDNVDYLTQMYFDQNRIGEAMALFEECKKVIGQNGLQFTREATKFYLRYSQLYEKIGDYKMSSFYQQKYINLKDSIYSSEWTVSLMKTEADNLEKENQAKIASQEQILILQEEAIRRQYLLNILVSLIAVILVVLAIVLFRSNRQKKTINHLLDLKVKDRTKELELNRNELLKACNERDLLLERTAQNIRSTVASIKGICEVGRKDLTDSNALRYIHEVEETSKSLTNTLHSLQYAQRKDAND